MSDDDHAWPSLLLAKHERAHREHVHQHQHHLFHRAQTGDTATATAVQSVVTEVTATVSVVQQIDVDSNGSTFAIQTVLADSTQGATGAAATSNTNYLTTTTSASPGPVSSSSSSASSTNAGGSPQISSASQSLNSSTSTSSASALSTSSSFSSLIASTNSTTLISSSSSSLTAIPNFSNSSISSSSTLSSSSFTYLTSSSSSSSEELTSSTSSTSSLYSPSSSSSVAGTSAGGGIGGGGAGSTSSAPTSTATSGSGNGTSSSNTPSTPVVVGGVVGSIAGAAILIFLLLAFIRWKKRHQSMLSLGSGNEGSGAVTSRDGPPPVAPSGGMTERRSLAFVPMALANLTGFNKRGSRQTDRTVSSTAESERGFYRVSGRKLPSVLQTGGDGYGDGIGEPNTLSGSSFYRDSQGFYGGPGSPSTAGPSGTSRRPESGVPVMRPSPARTPVTQQGPFSATPDPLTPPRRPDVLGRSHPSHDGSHTSSRFTEEIV
ncbi:uncharacterized protein LY89DRAFT_779685 [Mollisia scopiformis]|uniref:Uncharacterized protein n=1 Tax=Mollisia scopiformis TaxID=149040 RepID=A0A194XI19_MOLSC|nr:uncharacterized protein LY89DRAFT_779685 [Mollisia scopiformis]KUJ19781.1 hypothetical protein LY89DRAFT_779685 [Mollisia scopiformis]